MKSTRNAIVQFLLDNDGQYTNPLGVKTGILEDYKSFVLYTYLPHNIANPSFFFEICTQDLTPALLGKTTGIKTVAQLMAAHPQQLIDLYHKGIASKGCIIQTPDFDYRLAFTLKNGRMWLTDYEKNIRRVVPEKLETTEDFYAFTKHYLRRYKVFRKPQATKR